MIKIKFDLHIHSIYSLYDAFSKPEQIVKMAVRRGLDGIAITDHDTVLGGLKTIEYAKRRHPQLKVIPGIEVKTEDGHILALGVKSWNNMKDLSTTEVIERISELGGISVAAHPFDGFWRAGLIEKITEFDCIEVLNGKTRHINNFKAQMLSEKLDMPGIAGSDAHFIGHIGCAYTVCEGDVLEAIRKCEVSIGGSAISLKSLILSKIKRSLLTASYLIKKPSSIHDIIR